MKRLAHTTAMSLALLAGSPAALGADATSSATAPSADPMLSGVLPAETGSTSGAADPTTDADPIEETGMSSSQRSAKNAIYLDVAGPGGLYSVNYDRMLSDDLSVRIGFSYISAGASSSDGSGTTASAEASLLAIPITASYLGIGSLSNQLELGGGGAIMRATGDGFVSAGSDTAGASASATIIALTPLAGYRHQAPDGGFVFRIGASPLLFLGGEGGLLPWGYLSLGAAF